MTEAVEDCTFENFTFSHVARIEKGKNHEMVLAAVNKIKNRNFKVLLIGQGPQEENIKVLAHKMGISDKIVFLGYRHNVVKYVAKSQCHLLTSDAEGFPNAVLGSAWPVVRLLLAPIAQPAQGIIIRYIFTKTIMSRG